MRREDLSTPHPCLRLDSTSACPPVARALLLQTQVTQALKTAFGSLDRFHRQRDQQEKADSDLRRVRS